MTVVYCAIIIPLFPVMSNVYNLAMNIWVSQASYMFSMLPTYWVIKQYHKQLIRSKSTTKSIFYHDNADSVVSRTANSEEFTPATPAYEKRLPLEEILSTKDGFDLFANHLIREFSIENLFFVFEMMQTKRELLLKKFGNFRNFILHFSSD